MSPGDVTGEYAVRNCGEAYTEWNYTTAEFPVICPGVILISGAYIAFAK
jgi:hypothetical protein